MAVKKSLIFCMLLLFLMQFSSAGMFNIFNVSDSTQSFFFVNGSSGNGGIGKIYKEGISGNIDMFPSDPSGSLDDFFLGGYNG